MSNSVQTDDKKEDVLSRAVLMELENVAANGREIVYGVVQSVFESRGVSFNATAFSRFFLQRPLRQAIPLALDAAGKNESVAKMTAAVVAGIAAAFAGKDVLPAKGLDAVKRLVAGDANLSIGAISSLSEDVGAGLARSLDLVGDGAGILACDDMERSAPTADGWLKLAKLVDVPPTLCVAVATSAASSRAALSARMKCVVVADRFTAFQDFGGVDYVVDSLEEVPDKVSFLLADV